MKGTTVQKHEGGFAALVIAITLVIVTSLIVVGFAQLMRNEQNQVTNRQLSNQAYYAAETGINDAKAAIAAGYTAKKTTCGVDTTGAPGASYLTNNNVDTTTYNAALPGPTQWTCLLIEPTPSDIEYGSIDTRTPKVFTFHGTRADGITPSNVTSITFYWQDADAAVSTFRGNQGTNAGAFPPLASWNSTGMLRATITPLTSLDRDSLKASTYTAFFYPSTDSNNNTVSYDPTGGGNGAILDGACNTTLTATHIRYCQGTVDTSSLGTSGPFLVTLRSVYSKTQVAITINNNNGDRPAGAQSKIDSTGRAQDVLKRIEVRVPNGEDYVYPGFALETSGDICKQLTVYPGYASGCGY